MKMTPSKKKSKIKRSVIFPIIMLAYLAAMAWIGRDRLERGEYLYYFGIIGIGLVIIVLLTCLPHAILLSATGHLFPSAFSRSLVPVVAFGVCLVSVTFGLMSGRIHSFADIVSSLSRGIAHGAPLIILYVLFIQFYESLRFVFG